MDAQTVQAVQTIATIANDFSIWLGPLMMAAVAVITVFLFKDLMASVAKGVRFMMHPSFKEGDAIYLDGKKATIVKVGLFTTVFGQYNEDGAYCWRFVPNEKINSLRLEKIIVPLADQGDGKNKALDVTTTDK